MTSDLITYLLLILPITNNHLEIDWSAILQKQDD